MRKKILVCKKSKTKSNFSPRGAASLHSRIINNHKNLKSLRVEEHFFVDTRGIIFCRYVRTFVTGCSKLCPDTTKGSIHWGLCPLGLLARLESAMGRDSEPATRCAPGGGICPAASPPRACAGRRGTPPRAYARCHANLIQRAVTVT